MDQSLAILYTTTSTLEEAKYLAQHALTEGLAFCVNIIPQGISVYK